MTQKDALVENRLIDLSPAAARLLAEADKALRRNSPIAVERLLVELLAQAPNCVEANRMMGVALQMRGHHVKANGYLRHALAIRPDDAMIHMNLGSSLFANGEIDAGLASLRRACELAPDLAPAWYNLARALQIQYYFQEARIALQHALAIDPSHMKARMNLAGVQTSLGDISAAIVNYREILRRQPENPKAWFELANLKTVLFNKNDLARLQDLFQRSDLAADARVWLGFALAKALEDHENYPAAFKVLGTANALKRRYLQWSANADTGYLKSIHDAFSTPMPAPLDPTLGNAVIFIVSLPRSGSTLTEQILASHPCVEGGNEIPDLPQVIEDESKRRGQPFPLWVNSATADDWARLGKDYLARTQRWRQQRPIFTDKNLDNWRFVGAILNMLPGARVVNSRRDALETCFACYRQLFVYGAEFSYDLNDMVSHYKGYDRLSRYWERLFPNQFFDHVYELLLADPELQIRRLLDFCNLGFDPACLAFHQTSRSVASTASAAQVRQPLRSNTARGVFYGCELDQLRNLLENASLRRGDLN